MPFLRVPRRLPSSPRLKLGLGLTMCDEIGVSDVYCVLSWSNNVSS